ncbi:MAG: response regulator [Calditrichia bacterium]
MMMDNNKTILLVEDDMVDAMTVRRALKELQVSNPLTVKGNGEEALDYLKDSINEKPCIILLDLNMPRMNGIDFLKEVKCDDRLRSIPVIVLTTSKADQDVVTTFNMSIAGYMVKPVDYKQFVDTLRTIRIYWTLCELPVN